MKITTHKQASDLWLESKDGLRNYILKKTHDKNLSEEVTQEVLVKVYKSCCSDREIKNVRSWLFQIAHNTLIDHLREEQKLNNVSPPLDITSEENIWEDLGDFVEPLIGFLPEKYATPLRMADLQGMKQDLVASKLGLGLSATKSRIQRGRKMLKEEILTCFTIETNKDGVPVQFNLRESCTPLQKHRKKNC